MDNISKECRLEGYVRRPIRKRAILDVLGEREMTSREIAYELGFSDLNAVKPRLTEMKEQGLVEVVGKRKDILTDINVSVYKVTI